MTSRGGFEGLADDVGVSFTQGIAIAAGLPLFALLLCCCCGFCIARRKKDKVRRREKKIDFRNTPKQAGRHLRTLSYRVHIFPFLSAFVWIASVHQCSA